MERSIPCLRHSRSSHPHLAVLVQTLLWSNQLSARVIHRGRGFALHSLSTHGALRKPGVSLLFTDRQHLWEKAGDSLWQTDGWCDTHAPTVSSLHPPPPFVPPSPTHPLTLVAWGEDRGLCVCGIQGFTLEKKKKVLDQVCWRISKSRTNGEKFPSNIICVNWA